MTYKIQSIAPLRSALSLALVGFLLAYPLLGVLRILANFAPPPGPAPFHPQILLTVPLFVAGMIFVFATLGALAYNLVARLGLAVTVDMAKRDVPAAE